MTFVHDLTKKLEENLVPAAFGAGRSVRLSQPFTVCCWQSAAKTTSKHLERRTLSAAGGGWAIVTRLRAWQPP